MKQVSITQAFTHIFMSVMYSTDMVNDLVGCQ